LIITVTVFIIVNFLFIIWDCLHSIHILILAFFGERFYQFIRDCFKRKPAPLPNTIMVILSEVSIGSEVPLPALMPEPEPPVIDNTTEVQEVTVVEEITVVEEEEVEPVFIKP
jgi:hypothetical protein